VEWLQKLHQRQAVPSLPELQITKPRGPQVVAIDGRSDPPSCVRGRLADYQPLRLELIQDLAGRQLFQQYMERYHPLGYRFPYGGQMRYLVRAGAPSSDVLACLLFTSAAWKMTPRDRWIGWSDAARQANLTQVVNNGRFLILPWVEVPHLASHVLALTARSLPTDWFSVYGVRPLLLETLVDRPHTGTCYRAANWIYVGQTQGRGRMDSRHQAHGSCKDILLYPLESNCRERLCRVPAPQTRHAPVGEIP
jgi:hypothetical protein